jgi:Ca2+/H+ antiporter, TMEM165/GDT1 family
MFAAIFWSLGVVFLAELGDRSQLITMTYALRFRWWTVLPRVTIAAFGVPGVSVVPAIASLIFAGRAWAGIWIGRTLGIVSAGGQVGIFGLGMLFENALGWRPVAITVNVAGPLTAVSAAAAQTLRRRHTEASWTGRSPETV